MISLCSAGAKGVAIVIEAGGFVLTGSTCILLAAPGNQTAPESNLTQAEEFTPLTVTADGFSAVYTTSGSDFLAAGIWTLWLQVTTPSGQIITSAPGLVYVFPAPLVAA